MVLTVGTWVPMIPLRGTDNPIKGTDNAITDTGKMPFGEPSGGAHGRQDGTQRGPPALAICRCIARRCTLIGGHLPPHAASAPGLGSPLPTSAPGLGSPLSHLRRDWARPCPHLRRDWTRPCPHLHRDWAHRCHICAGTSRGHRPISASKGQGEPPSIQSEGPDPTDAVIPRTP
jgi:hypothetical protein